MDDRKNYEQIFPKDFDYLNASYQKFQQTLTSIDYELDNASKDKGPSPAPAPKGLRPINPELRQQRKDYLERTRERRIETFKGSIQKQIGGFDQKSQQTINARLDFETSRNGFKDYSKSDLKAVKDIPKEDKVSFDYMAAKHFNKYQTPDKSIADEKENMDAWSDRFQNQLDYYRHNCDKELVPEISEPDLDKD